MTLLILAFGFLFGAILQCAGLNKYNTISGMARLEDFTVAKAIAVAVGVGAIFLSVEIGMGFASFHVKPILLIGIIAGGLLFGAGMAVLGYCPGTLPISLGQGSIDALIGILGGISGGIVYTLLDPFIKDILGPDLGKHSLETALRGGSLYYILVVLFGLILVGIAFLLNKIERKSNYNWFYAGIGLAILNCLVFLTSIFDRQIGASSTYPYVGDLLAGLTINNYFTSIEKSGSWELIFLGGAMLSGLVISMIRKDFRIQLIHSGWSKTKGKSRTKRIFWAFLGGFIMLIGARMAGGCTSGHVISGGMQIAASSLLFGTFVFVALLLTGKYFYRKG